MDNDPTETPKPEPNPVPRPAPHPLPPQQELSESPPVGNAREYEAGGVPRGTRVALVLFLLTCLSTFAVGFVHDGLPVLFLKDKDELHDMFTTELLQNVLNGFAYAGCVMAILGAHELGHYFQARRYGVPATLPLFIPFPISPFGTMGAVIIQQSGVADRKSMFDIAITGPLAGLFIALPLAYLGIRQAEPALIIPTADQVITIYSDPLLLQWMIRAVHGALPQGQDISINPMLFAGWVGVFITALNLIPIGQLDGGHILYCLIGKRAHYVARGLFWAAAGTVGYSVIFGDRRFMLWSLMLFLIWLMGTRHPRTSNDSLRLGRVRVVLGWLTLMFVFIGLTPVPVYEISFRSKSRPPIRRRADHEVRIGLKAPSERPV